MVNDLTLSKIIKLNTDVKDAPADVFFSTKQCQSVVNHKCIEKEPEDNSYLLKKIGRILTDNKKATTEHQESLRKEKDEKIQFRTATIILPIIIVVLACLILAVMKHGKKHFPKRADPKETSKYVYIPREITSKVRHRSTSNDIS